MTSFSSSNPGLRQIGYLVLLTLNIPRVGSLHLERCSPGFVDLRNGYQKGSIVDLGELKSQLKSRLPRLFVAMRKVKWKFESWVGSDFFSRRQLAKWSYGRLISILRNDAHRIEKSVYSKHFYRNVDYYQRRRQQVRNILEILAERGHSLEEPTIVWARTICDDFFDLETKFIEPSKKTPKVFAPLESKRFLEFVTARRSTRVWASVQPPAEDLIEIAHKMIDAGRWAPSSGNRQAWRFSVMATTDEKRLLYPIKEVHCYTAPIAIFVGMETDAFVYENTNICMYVDAGMAMMNMVLLAHSCGLGTVVNHFGMDLIKSRRANVKAYEKFVHTLRIPRSVVPVAIINVGVPEFIPPVPARAMIDALLIAR